MFANARIFEEQLVQMTRAALEGKGQVVGNQVLSESGAGGPGADLIFVPTADAFAGRPTILEFKFSRTTTLPHSIVLGALQQFAAIREANLALKLRFVLVTNGRVRDERGRSEDVTIIDGIKNKNVWRRELAGLLGEAS